MFELNFNSVKFSFLQDENQLLNIYYSRIHTLHTKANAGKEGGLSPGS